MPIIINLDVVMARRKIGAGELAEKVGITPANLSILKNNKAKAVRFSTLAALCLHRTMGGWQFGARYTVDLIPFALWWYLARPRRPLGAGALWLAGAGALFNFYGAVYMLSH